MFYFVFKCFNYFIYSIFFKCYKTNFSFYSSVKVHPEIVGVALLGSLDNSLPTYPKITTPNSSHLFLNSSGGSTSYNFSPSVQAYQRQNIRAPISILLIGPNV